ncbi:Uclacyanin-2 [Hibiscus syriacus]|uniref:Uclacyanin-2 n=1 Tax=Hibiscus syriacus TaxID=106335 RepID=A0A6A2Y684_HIBSY|nr:uclacyanin-3-like [Hibiscus syriacus]KAE8676795.1 Uclacyanin-2 [Hibiscus syriacus]
MGFAAAFLLLLLLAAPAAHAVQYTVGDSAGWTNSGDYEGWVQGKAFTVGDTLLFRYGGSHAVDVVSKNDYDNCNSGNALSSHSDGNTVIPLSNPGPMYFICPTIGHCAGGMKLAINVVAAGGNSPSTPSGSPTTPGTTPSGGSTPSPPSPRPSGAPSIMNSGFVLAFLAVLGAVLAVMS